MDSPIGGVECLHLCGTSIGVLIDVEDGSLVVKVKKSVSKMVASGGGDEQVSLVFL